LYNIVTVLNAIELYPSKWLSDKFYVMWISLKFFF
jgi:hypothetical protein